MDRLRRSFRDSFRKKKDHVPESSKPHQWQDDERAVRMGSCSFPVKYLGCVEVFESRGMQVCEEALKALKLTRRRPLKAILYVTGDGLRVVDEETKGLVVDQTIEKVSFCAPDRNHERGFSYICRDGTTRRWLCHGFHATKDSGERLSHAVGCAFAVCLERKQKRDKELANNVTMNFDSKTSTFTRCGSFRQSSITDRIKDPQVAKPAAPPPVKPVHNPFAIERPHATPQLLQRQGSFRGFGALNQSPFKRQLSLRINELPSNVERQRAQSLSNDIFNVPRAGGASVAPITEAPANEKTSDSISEMCKELSGALKMLSSNEDPFSSPILSPSSDKYNNLDKDDGKSGTSIVWPSSLVTSTTCPMLSEQCKSPTSSADGFRNIPLAPPRSNGRRPDLSQLRSQSLVTESSLNRTAWPASTNDRSPMSKNGKSFARGGSFDAFKERSRDPFDSSWAEWATTSKTESNQFNNKSANPLNPFTQGSTVKTFEVQL